MLGNVHEAQDLPGKPQRVKRSIACSYCRLKKVRCNAQRSTCGNCVDRGEKCVYPTKTRRNSKNKTQPYPQSNEALIDRINRMEAILKESNVPTQKQGCEENSEHILAAEGLQMMSSARPDQQMQLQQPSPPQTAQPNQSTVCTPPYGSYSDMRSYRHNSHTSVASSVSLPLNQSTDTTLRDTQDQSFHEEIQVHLFSGREDSPVINGELSGDANIAHHDTEPAAKAGLEPDIDRSVNSVYSPENSDWEYHGPGAFLSLCSKPSVDWVVDRTGSTEFAQIARNFSRSTTKPLKLDEKINTNRAPEPDRATAFRYSKTYFDNGPDMSYNIVIRSQFEARLKAFYDTSGGASKDDGASWYALRNVIYAHGARYELGRGGYSVNYTRAQIAGFQFFENAMSKYTELCFCRTGLMAVQALLCMALYAEALSSPSIEYMLASAALRLAQSKGFHRQPGPTWGLSQQDTDHRNWIFWSLYTFEKHIAHRSGRPSAIDDDDISCQIPSKVPPDCKDGLEFCTLSTKHAQISSQIAKRCSTVAAYRQTSEDILQTVCDLDRQLREWCSHIPLDIRPGTMFDSSNLPKDFEMIHVINLHYSYFGSLISIHSIFTYPWSVILDRDKSPRLREQLNASTEIVADASRSIILMSKYINDIYAWTTTWLGFYYPILGLINLFIHVLKYPTAPTALSDIALIDVMSGHFARMEFASSGQLSFSIARDLSALARMTVKHAQQVMQNADDRGNLTTNVDQTYVRLPCELMPPNAFDFGPDNMDMGNFNLEDWSTLLPSFSPHDMMNFDIDVEEDIFIRSR